MRSREHGQKDDDFLKKPKKLIVVNIKLFLFHGFWLGYIIKVENPVCDL